MSCDCVPCFVHLTIKFSSSLLKVPEDSSGRKLALTAKFPKGAWVLSLAVSFKGACVLSLTESLNGARGPVPRSFHLFLGSCQSKTPIIYDFLRGD